MAALIGNDNVYYVTMKTITPGEEFLSKKTCFLTLQGMNLVYFNNVIKNLVNVLRNEVTFIQISQSIFWWVSDLIKLLNKHIFGTLAWYGKEYGEYLNISVISSYTEEWDFDSPPPKSKVLCPSCTWSKDTMKISKKNSQKEHVPILQQKEEKSSAKSELWNYEMLICWYLCSRNLINYYPSCVK